jgi:hypothetical protein
VVDRSYDRAALTGDYERHRAHGSYSSSYLQVPREDGAGTHLGVMTLLVCNTCGHLDVGCEHETCDWGHRVDCDGWSRDQDIVLPLTGSINPGDTAAHLAEVNSVGRERCEGCILRCRLCSADCT